jgi:hypothetical protein
MNEIDIYAVGLLAHLRDFWHSPRTLRNRLRRLAYDLRTGIIDRVRARRWRALRTYFDGYHAEHTTLGSRVGTGWTRGRAYDDLMRHLAATGQADG